MMLRILCTTYSSDDHPSNVLREMEVIVTSIDAEGGWWRSEFASKIQHTVALEWVPILADNRLITLVFLFDSFARKGLQSVASKLLFVGLIDFFRSGLFILPILTLLAEIALIVQKINNKSGFSPENIIKLLKSSLLLMVAAMAIRIIGMLPGLGYSTSMLGLLIFIISSVDPLLKLLCPYVAPNMAQLSSFAQRMETLENQVTESVRKILDKEHFTSTVKSVSEYVLAKELISNADIPTDLSMNRNETMGQEPSSIDIGTGLRKRKVA